MNTSKLLVKYTASIRDVTISFAGELAEGETIVSSVINPSNPTGLTLTALGDTTTDVSLRVSGGVNERSYGVLVQATTSTARTLEQMLAVVVNDSLDSSYVTQNDVAFEQIVGKLEAGEAGLGKVNFQFPSGFAADNGFVDWVLIDKDGVIHSSGTSFDYEVNTTSSVTTVSAQSVINVPSDVVPTLDGQSYQIRWSLTIGTAKYFSFESLVVTGELTDPVGVEDIVEMEGEETIQIGMISERPWDSVTVQVYYRNEAQMMSPVGATGTRIPSGWMYRAELTGLNLPANLEPYSLVWSLRNQESVSSEKQTGRLFVVNASIMQATEDMKSHINKSYTSVLQKPDILFTVPLLLAYLRRGRDAFNIAWGMFTDFTMINATGGIREMWLRFAEVMALRAQYLAEGEKVFNFQGQQITLDRDVTQYYEGLANSMQQDLDANGKAIKQNLIKKGIISGDGNADSLGKGRLGAMGTTGITLSPATPWGRFGSRIMRGY